MFQAINVAGTVIDLSEIETLDYYISYSGNIQQSASFAYTSAIDVKKGQTVAMWAKGYQQAVAMISVYANSAYTPKVISDGGDLKLYSYTADDDCKVAFSYDYRVDHAVLLTSEAIQAVTEYVYASLPLTNLHWGQFINMRGEISSGANDFRYTYLFDVKAGQTVVFTAAGYNTNVAMIARYNGEGVNYTPLVICTDSNVNEYRYHANEDMQIALSFDNTKSHAAYRFIDMKSESHAAIDYSVMFPKMSVVGDSLSSGCLYQDEQYTDYYGNSWLTYITRRSNLQRNHYSVGGLTAKAWLESQYCTKLQSDQASDLYFIALGTNDSWLTPYPVGSVTDEPGANTFAGYMKQIVNIVRTKAPNAPIFMISMYKKNAAFDTVISGIAGLNEGVYYLPFDDFSEINTDTGGVWSAGSHFTTIGYQYVANVILNLMNSAIEKNMSDFKFFGKYTPADQYDFGQE